MTQFTSASFVGRVPEMAALHAAIADAFAGRGRLVLLAGEPGIGKTRTAHEFAEKARQQGALVLAGRCYEGDGAPPFWPWVQIVRAYSADRDPAALRTEMGTGAANIAAVIAEVRERLPGLSLPAALEPEPARFRFFDSLTTFLKNIGQVQPLVLILDDVQWADKPSLLLLRFLVRELADAHLLIIGTYRDVALESQHPLAQLLEEIVREPHSQRLVLRGLTAEEVTRFIELATGTTPSEPLSTTLAKEAGGNPFFISEIVRLLVAEGGHAALYTPRVALTIPLPQSVREVINRRLERLSAECKRMLSLASVIGREFSMPTLAQMKNTNCDQLLEVLDEALTARLVTAVPHVVGSYSFAHALIREALYTELPTARRVQLHRHIAEALETIYGHNRQSAPATNVSPVLSISSAGQGLAELAYHFFEALRGESDADKAIAYAVQAAEQALAVLAYEDAVTHYERALQALEYKQPLEGRQRYELLLALGTARTKTGDIPQAREACKQAAEEARKLQNSELLAHAALGFEKFGVPIGVVDHDVVHLLEEVLGVFGTEDSALRARMLARLAWELHFSASDGERRAQLSQLATAMARRVGDKGALAAALDSRRRSLWGPGDIHERLAAMNEILRLAEETGDGERSIQGQFDRIVDLLELGDMLAVDEGIAAYARRAEELRQPRYRWNWTVLQTMRALMEGRFAGAEQLAMQTLTLGRKIESPTAINFFGVQMFSLSREQGRLQELESAVQNFVAQYPTVPAWRAALASLYSELGRETEARTEFTRLAVNDFVNLPRDSTWLVGATLLAETCAFLADSHHAVLLYERLLPYAEHNVVVGDGAACNGSVSRPLGLLAATLHRWQEAVAHFESALRMNTRMGAKPFVTRTQYEYAATLLARHQPGDDAQARALLAPALVTAQELGMKGLEKKIAASLREVSDKAKQNTGDVPYRVDSEHPTATAELPAANLFHYDAEYWTLRYQGTTCRLKDTKGLRYIAFLLDHPGQECLVTEVMESVGGSDTAAKRTSCDRNSEFPLERVRLNVTKAIKAAVKKVSDNHPALGYHLTATIKTGTYCSYTPDPIQPISWVL